MVEVFDDITGEKLPADLVAAARAKEIAWVRDRKLYAKIDRSVASSRGFKPITVRWVDVNKGDREH